MKISEQWLREWVNPPIDTEQLVAQLTTAGLEVDSFEPVSGDLAGVVVGSVVAVRGHPDADRLSVCEVDIGEDETLQVVCGAPNARRGLCAPYIPVGATLPNGHKIRASKIRGVRSNGMLCSAKELDLGEDSDGLLELPDDAPAGAPLREYLKLDDTSIDIELTPNRGDCLAIAGIAREVGVLNRTELCWPTLQPVPPVHQEGFPVVLESPEDCPRYAGRLIRDISCEAVTPVWLKERLRRCGVRSISPVVDVTNYVMLELGQPMHAFDFDSLDRRIRVRHAKQGERLALLDGQEIALHQSTLVIADEDRAIALAGVMGGMSTAVSDETRNIFLESAFFAPRPLAGEARRYGLHTDASHRFERGVDPFEQRRAVERATELLQQIVGGAPGPIIEACAPEHLPEREQVCVRASRIRRVLGVDVPPNTVTDALERLGMRVERVSDGWTVVPPGFRFDIAIEADLIEEVARLVGYDEIPPHRPFSELMLSSQREEQRPLSAFRSVLVARGYREAITYSFVSDAEQNVLNPGVVHVSLLNPISSDLSVMRTSLWPGLVDALRYNLKRQRQSVRLFECGLLFRREGADLVQKPMLSGVVTGYAVPEQWGVETRGVDFFDIKGDVEALVSSTAPDSGCHFEAVDHPALHPGRSAAIYSCGEELGRMGQLHPTVMATLKLNAPVYVFEIDLALLSRGQVPQYRAISRYPTMRRDIAVVVDESISAQAVRDCVGQSASDMLENLELFDVYRGKGIDSGKKSLALSLTFQATSRTLRDKEVDDFMARVIESLRRDLGGVLRG